MVFDPESLCFFPIDNTQSDGKGNCDPVLAALRGAVQGALELRLQMNGANPGLLFYDTVSLRVQTVQLMVDESVSPESGSEKPE